MTNFNCRIIISVCACCIQLRCIFLISGTCAGYCNNPLPILHDVSAGEKITVNCKSTQNLFESYNQMNCLALYKKKPGRTLKQLEF